MISTVTRYLSCRGCFWVGLILMSSLGACGRNQESAPMPVKQVTARRILSYADQQAPMQRLRTSRDVLPGGWAAAMAPVLVDWAASAQDSGVYRLMNVNYGGNPMDGTTVLRTALVPAGDIRRVEFIIVPLDPLGRHGIVAHAMIRFVFSEQHPLILLDEQGAPLSGDPAVGDLILSWEAWRAPGVDFEVLAGMDPGTYGLSLRAYAGPQRFLEDYLQHRDWYAYTLDLPGRRQGDAALLQVMLAMGDGAARRTLGRIFSRAEREWLQGGPGAAAATEEAWRGLRASVLQGMSAEDSLLLIPPDKLSYQTTQRSCATMALYCIDVAISRLTSDGHQARLTLDEAIGPVRPWMRGMAHADPVGIFLRSPYVLEYVVRHPQIIPTRIPGILDKAGLLPRHDGRAIKIHYALDATPPYGDIRNNLIR